MGYEYRISFPYVNGNAVARELGRLASTGTAQSSAMSVEFRSEEHCTGMPDAVASVEDYGVYFCDNGNGKESLGRVVSCLVSVFGAVEVAELE